MLPVPPPLLLLLLWMLFPYIIMLLLLLLVFSKAPLPGTIKYDPEADEPAEDDMRLGFCDE